MLHTVRGYSPRDGERFQLKVTATSVLSSRGEKRKDRAGGFLSFLFFLFYELKVKERMGIKSEQLAVIYMCNRMNGASAADSPLCYRGCTEEV